MGLLLNNNCKSVKVKILPNMLGQYPLGLNQVGL